MTVLRQHQSEVPPHASFPRVALLALAALLAWHSSACKNPASSSQATPAKQQPSVISTSVDASGFRVSTPAAEFVLNSSGYLRASLKSDGKLLTLDDPENQPGQLLLSGKTNINDFTFDLASAKITDAAGKLGALGKRIEFAGKNAKSNLEETLTLEVYDDFPSLALLSATLRNSGSNDVPIDSFVLQRHQFNARLVDAQAKPHEMWSFIGASLKWGKDDVLPIPAKFSQQNPFGTPVEVKDDLGRVGGGIPVVAFWTRNVGEAIGHIETLPLPLSIPVQTGADQRVTAAVQLPANTDLKSGEVYSTPRTFLAVYKGDYYEPLNLWSNVVEREGLSRPTNNDENYAVSWCGWGYESDVTPKQMVDTIPKLKEFGIHWATLDDRWFNNYGDWQPRTDTFPGDAIKKLADDFHAQGMKMQLWWLPLAVEDGHYGYGAHKFVTSDVVKQHPDWLILDESGKPARMTRNLATLCPAVPEVQAYYKQLTERFIRDWGFDGHKLDNIYSTPPCYNPKHHHRSPLDSVYAMGEVYKIIFETTRALKPDSITQSCPCGTPPSLAWFRYMDQAVTADPVGSVQVRRRMKMYKALLGPRAAVYGDHVELTRIRGTGDNELDLGNDFASTLGTGGVLGTKFTWPDYGPKYKTVYLTPAKEAHWKKWLALYNQKMLSKGTFRNLYTYGYDSPEGYAIEKDGSMFYAFFAPEAAAAHEAAGTPEAAATLGKSPATLPTPLPTWSGQLQLRGLDPNKTYRLTDYVNNKDYGSVTGPIATIPAQFQQNLLLQATPIANPPNR